MDLSLLEDDPLNTVILLPGGQPLYSVETPFKLLGGRTTTIVKMNGAQSTQVASIRWHTLGDPELQVLGNLLMPLKTGMFSASETFRASDGRSYKWKIDAGVLFLVLNDGSHTTVAVFVESSFGFFSTPRPASLRITPGGMPILDDLITTFVYMEHKRRIRRRRSRNAGRNGAMMTMMH